MVFLNNVEIKTYNYQQYLFCDVDVPRDIVVKKVSVGDLNSFSENLPANTSHM